MPFVLYTLKCVVLFLISRLCFTLKVLFCFVECIRVAVTVARSFQLAGRKVILWCARVNFTVYKLKENVAMIKRFALLGRVV